MTSTTQPEDKSVGAALALTLFFGPLGHFYLSVTRGIVFTLISIVVMAFTFGIAGIIIWPMAMIWAATDAGKRHSAYEAWLHGRAPAPAEPASMWPPAQPTA